MSWLLFRRGYVFTMRLRLPGGEEQAVRVTGRNFDDFGREAFLAGMRFGQQHPELAEPLPLDSSQGMP